MSRVNLTEARIKALKPAASLRDAVVPSLIVRAGTGTKRVYALHTRFPGFKHPTRRVIAEVGAVTLDSARNTARDWLELIRQGKDPQQEAHRRADAVHRAVELQRAQQQSLFAQVCDDCLKRKVAGQRRARAVERIVRNACSSRRGVTGQSAASAAVTLSNSSSKSTTGRRRCTRTRCSALRIRCLVGR
jgi:hypothetical protein